MSEENVERVRQYLLRNPKKPVRRASRELEMSSMTVWEGAAKETANEALPSPHVAASETDKPHRTK